MAMERTSERQCAVCKICVNTNRVAKGSDVNFKGYVQDEDELDSWQYPLGVLGL